MIYSGAPLLKTEKEVYTSAVWVGFAPKFRETFRSVSVKRFAKFRIISEVSEAEVFAKFRSVSTISVGSEIQIVSEIQVCDDSSKQSLKLLNLYDFFP